MSDAVSFQKLGVFLILTQSTLLTFVKRLWTRPASAVLDTYCNKGLNDLILSASRIYRGIRLQKKIKWDSLDCKEEKKKENKQSIAFLPGQIPHLKNFSITTHFIILLSNAKKPTIVPFINTYNTIINKIIHYYLHKPHFLSDSSPVNHTPSTAL